MPTVRLVPAARYQGGSQGKDERWLGKLLPITVALLSISVTLPNIYPIISLIYPYFFHGTSDEFPFCPPLSTMKPPIYLSLAIVALSITVWLKLYLWMTTSPHSCTFYRAGLFWSRVGFLNYIFFHKYIFHESFHISEMMYTLRKIVVLIQNKFCKH